MADDLENLYYFLSIKDEDLSFATCSKCNVSKGLGRFSIDRSRPNQRQVACKDCNASTVKSTKVQRKLLKSKYYAKNKDKVKAAVKAYALKNHDKITIDRRKYYESTVAKRMLYEAQRRSVKFNIPFSIDINDCKIPERCPVLDILLFIGKGMPGDGSPSLDRIVPELGYVKGNIKVISHRANRLKSDATIEEFSAILNYMRTNGN